MRHPAVELPPSRRLTRGRFIAYVVSSDGAGKREGAVVVARTSAKRLIVRRNPSAWVTAVNVLAALVASVLSFIVHEPNARIAVFAAMYAAAAVSAWRALSYVRGVRVTAAEADVTVHGTALCVVLTSVQGGRSITVAVPPEFLGLVVDPVQAVSVIEHLHWRSDR